MRNTLYQRTRAVLVPRVIGHHCVPGPRERISLAFPRGEGVPTSPPGGSNREPSGRRCSLPIGFRRLRPTTILPLLCVESYTTTVDEPLAFFLITARLRRLRRLLCCFLNDHNQKLLLNGGLSKGMDGRCAVEKDHIHLIYIHIHAQTLSCPCDTHTYNSHVHFPTEAAGTRREWATKQVVPFVARAGREAPCVASVTMRYTYTVCQYKNHHGLHSSPAIGIFKEERRLHRLNEACHPVRDASLLSLPLDDRIHRDSQVVLATPHLQQDRRTGVDRQDPRRMPLRSRLFFRSCTHPTVPYRAVPCRTVSCCGERKGAR